MRHRFADFVLDTNRLELTKDDELMALEPKTFDLLCLLVEHRHRVVSKDEIFETIWPDVYVSDASISSAIKQIRKALGDDGEAQRFVRTLRGKGFRFVAEVDSPPAAQVAALRQAAAPLPVESPGKGRAPVIAVLPFKRIASDDTHAAISEGIPIELISALSRLRSIRVIARGSTFQFDPTAPDLAAVRTKLGADYALTGAVELLNGRLFITTELTETKALSVLWGETYSGPLDDVFDLRQRILRDVCTAIELRVPAHEADALADVPSEHLDAWGHYHRGIRHLFRFNGRDNEIARHHMQRALQLDPGFARAYAGLSYAEMEDYNLFFGSDRMVSWSKGMDAAERGVDQDPLDPFCNLVLGRAKWIAGDLDAALAWTDRSVALNRNYAFGHYNLGKFNAIHCAGEAADGFAASAIALSPIDPHMQSILSTRAVAGLVADKSDDALHYARQSLRAPNPHLYVRVVAASILAHYGQRAAAEQAVAGIGQAYAGFTKTHFKSLFTLRDPQKNKCLLDGLSSLGL